MERFFTASAWVRPGERLRTALGALLGLVFVGLIGAWLNRRLQVPLGLIAPLGASAVLLFAVPASPLAQPWSILAGNMLAALVGVTVTLYVTPVELAAGLAVGLSIALMATFRCLHPPSGAIALTAVLGAAQATGAAAFIVWSVAANSALLLLSAVLFHRLTGHVYPEFLRKPVGSATASGGQDAATAQIVREVLAASDDVLDISSQDVRALYERISLRIATARHNALDCRALMTRMPEALSPDMPLSKAFDEVVRQPGHAMLVSDESAHVIGLVTLADFAQRADLTGEKIRVAFGQRLRNAARLRSAPHHVVGDIMHRSVTVVNAADPASKALVALTETGLPFIPVLNAGKRMIGIITQAQALAFLARDGAMPYRKGAVSASA